MFREYLESQKKIERKEAQEQKIHTWTRNAAIFRQDMDREGLYLVLNKNMELKIRSYDSAELRASSSDTLKSAPCPTRPS